MVEPISEAHVERLRAMYLAYSRQDFDEAAKLAHPDIEMIRAADGVLRGADAVRAWMEPDALEDHTVEPLDFRVSGDMVVVHQHHSARGAGSGIDVEAEIWALWTFAEDGRAIRLEVFLTEGDALKAAGLAGGTTPG